MKDKKTKQNKMTTKRQRREDSADGESAYKPGDDIFEDRLEQKYY